MKIRSFIELYRINKEVPMLIGLKRGGADVNDNGKTLSVIGGIS